MPIKLNSWLNTSWTTLLSPRENRSSLLGETLLTAKPSRWKSWWPLFIRTSCSMESILLVLFIIQQPDKMSTIRRCWNSWMAGVQVWKEMQFIFGNRDALKQLRNNIKKYRRHIFILRITQILIDKKKLMIKHLNIY